MTVYKRESQTIEDVVVISREEHIRLQDSHQELLELEDHNREKDSLIEKLYLEFVPHCDECDPPPPVWFDEESSYKGLLAAVTASLTLRCRAGISLSREETPIIRYLCNHWDFEYVSGLTGYSAADIEYLLAKTVEEN